MQHQPLRDRDVHDHLPDAAQRGHAYFHFAETQSVEEPQDALHLKELAFAVFEPIIPLAFVDFFYIAFALLIVFVCCMKQLDWALVGLTVKSCYRFFFFVDKRQSRSHHG